MSSKSQPKWLIGVSAVTFLLGALSVAGSLRMAEHCKNLRRMTCDDLIRNGPGKQQFLTLTDVQVCSAGYAFHRDMDAAMEMYVPIYPGRLKQEPPPADLKLLLQVFDDRQREQVLERPNVGELNVELWTPAGQLDPWVLDRLNSVYPGIQVANCRVLSIGLHEPSAILASSLMNEGIVLLIVAVACQAGWWIWRSAILRPFLARINGLAMRRADRERETQISESC